MGEEEAGEKTAPAKPEKSEPAGRVLTMERFERLKETAHTSFTAFKACLNCYHLAVRSIEEKQPELEGDEDDSKKKKKRSGKNAKKKEKQTLIRIDDEATFSAVLEWSVTNMVGLLKLHAGELQARK